MHANLRPRTLLKQGGSRQRACARPRVTAVPPPDQWSFGPAPHPCVAVLLANWPYLKALTAQQAVYRMAASPHDNSVAWEMNMRDRRLPSSTPYIHRVGWFTIYGVKRPKVTWVMRDAALEGSELFSTTWGTLTCTAVTQHTGVFGFCLHGNTTATARIEPTSLGSTAERPNHWATVEGQTITMLGSFTALVLPAGIQSHAADLAPCIKSDCGSTVWRSTTSRDASSINTNAWEFQGDVPTVQYKQ